MKGIKHFPEAGIQECFSNLRVTTKKITIGKKGLLILLAFVLLLPLPIQASDQLYEVTFSSPAHTVGKAPSVLDTGTPRACPTYDRFGTSLVVSTFGALVNQPLHLIPGPTGGGFNYAQLQFNLTGLYGFTTNYPVYSISMDLYLNEFEQNDWFSVFVDTPDTVGARLDLTTSGTIVRNRPYPLPPVDMGSFQFGTVFRLEIDVNVPSNTWTVLIDNQPKYAGQFYYPIRAHPDFPASLFSVRINLNDDPSNPNMPSAGMDNFRVAGVIPEPGSAALVLLGVSLFLLTAMKPRRSVSWHRVNSKKL